MRFERQYERRLSRSGDTYKYGPQKCLLEFFGFKYETWTSSYQQRVWSKDDRYVNGGVYLSNTEHDHYEGYIRAENPTGRAAELENRFIELRGENFNPLKMPYEKKSVKEYYDSLDYPGKNEAFDGCFNSFLIAVVWCIICVIFNGVLDWIKANIISSIFVIAFVVIPIVIWLSGIIIGAIKQKINRKKYGKRIEFENLSIEEKECYRQEYLSKLEKSYSGESGQILKEYAILKGYDKI